MPKPDWKNTEKWQSPKMKPKKPKVYTTSYGANKDSDYWYHDDAVYGGSYTDVYKKFKDKISLNQKYAINPWDESEQKIKKEVMADKESKSQSHFAQFVHDDFVSTDNVLGLKEWQKTMIAEMEKFTVNFPALGGYPVEMVHYPETAAGSSFGASVPNSPELDDYLTKDALTVEVIKSAVASMSLQGVSVKPYDGDKQIQFYQYNSLKDPVYYKTEVEVSPAPTYQFDYYNSETGSSQGFGRVNRYKDQNQLARAAEVLKFLSPESDSLFIIVPEHVAKERRIEQVKQAMIQFAETEFTIMKAPLERKINKFTAEQVGYRSTIFSQAAQLKASNATIAELEAALVEAKGQRARIEASMVTTERTRMFRDEEEHVNA